MLRTATLAAPLALCAIPAFAQITATDVWDQGVALQAAAGGTMTVTAPDGGAGTYTDIAMDWSLPMGLGSFGIALSEMSLTENGDGTVAIAYPPTLRMRAYGDIAGEAAFSLEIDLVTDDDVTTASGTPGDITYASRSGPTTMTFVSLSVDGGDTDIDGDTDMSGDVTIDGADSTIQVDTTGDLVTVVGTSSTGTMLSDFTFEAGAGYRSTDESEYGPSAVTFDIALPAGGSDPMNLAPALRDGLRLVSETVSGPTTSLATGTSPWSDAETREYTSSAGGTTSLTIDETGIDVSLDIAEIVFEVDDPFMGRIGADATAARMRFAMPLLASTDAQDAALSFDIDALRLGPAIWAQLDPDKQLARDPLDMDLDATVGLVLDIDLPDVAAVGAAMDRPTPPGSVTRIDVASAGLAALGASATGMAGFAFSDMDIDPVLGFPVPSGSASFTLTGVNALLDRLVDAGIIAPEEIFGARLALGMVTQATDEDDVLTGTIDIDAAGTITANGIRIR